MPCSLQSSLPTNIFWTSEKGSKTDLSRSYSPHKLEMAGFNHWKTQYQGFGESAADPYKCLAFLNAVTFALECKDGKRPLDSFHCITKLIIAPTFPVLPEMSFFTSQTIFKTFSSGSTKYVTNTIVLFPSLLNSNMIFSSFPILPENARLMNPSLTKMECHASWDYILQDSLAFLQLPSMHRSDWFWEPPLICSLYSGVRAEKGCRYSWCENFTVGAS